MIQRVPINVNDIIPASRDVLNHQGISENSVIPDHIISLFEDAVVVFKLKAKPIAIIKKVTVKEFDIIFRGEGKNADEAPLENIYPHSGNLALFALTLGNEIVEIINDLFNKNDFAPGAMLDSVASMAADKSVEILENYIFNNLSERNLTKNDSIVLGYSPGYCGWDLSGQKKLFQHLNPGKIGITINESFLMTPLKSVSGVLVHSDKEIHIFESSFTFCRYCKNKTCYERMEKILEH
ncbi:MAG: vitamin B12 dependent-methionine synthase activation domain-containing protein [Ignavibacteriaceae bacterium]